MEGSDMRKKSFTRQVGVLFSEETYKNLIEITDEIEISVSEFIRSIVEEKIYQKKKEDKCNAYSN
jgi:hypothetical protein